QIRFLVARDGGGPASVLPFAILEGPHGAVINSLPYYGTCAGVIGRNNPAMASAMCAHLLAHARAQNVAAVTLVDDWRAQTFSRLSGADFVTNRTNQFIDLASFRGKDPLDFYHQKTRNLVRKADKIGISIRRASGEAEIAGLAAAHRENMAGVNGIAKPQRFFDMLADPARPLGEHRLHVASIDGRDCGFLLNFHCGDTVEYYMPAVHVADRALQPLSLLIHHAIREAVADGLAFWNFGGTWPTQDSLRHFKIRWGSSEASYSYFTYVLDQRILENSAPALLAAYPYFFVAPFDQLGQNRAGGGA
ncbi:MAG: GNAT family N-acetyltransferase, partial [Bosea sp. (in: a-proteobacteria)]